jgi:ubiquinone/menaquinone biosynthesis C-methylase UbiE
MADEIDREKDRVTGVFDRAASKYDRAGPRVFSHFGQRLVDIAKLAPGSQVLDVAAGRGAVMFPAAKQVGARGRVVGIDLSADMVRKTAEEMRGIGLQNAEVRQMDAERLDFPDASFDLVLCGMGLWFFPRPHVALKEFLRVLRPGGRIGLSTWAKDCPYTDFSARLARPYLPAGATVWRTAQDVTFKIPEQLYEALPQAGFENVKVQVEEQDIVYADEEEWLASLWTSGFRHTLEQLSPPVLDQAIAHLRKEIQAIKQPDGIHLLARALITFGAKPAAIGH